MSTKKPTSMQHDTIQALLNRYQDFRTSGNLGRRCTGEEEFFLGKALCFPVDSGDHKLFAFRCYPDRVADELREYLLIQLGTAYVYGENKNGPATTKEMASDVRLLEGLAKAARGTLLQRLKEAGKA